MQLGLVDVFMKMPRNHKVQGQDCTPLQDTAHQPVHRHAHQPLAELAVAVRDRADDDGGQRDVVRAGKHDGVGTAVDEDQLSQLPGGQDVDHDEAENQDGCAHQEVQDGGQCAFEDRIEVDGAQLDGQVHDCLLFAATRIACG